MPQAIAAFVSTIKIWIVTYWHDLRNGGAKSNGLDAGLEEPREARFPDQPDEDQPPLDVPPYPGWLQTEDGHWADPNCKFIHLEDLLDQIPICQKLLKAMRRQDPGAYEYHRRLGARLIPDTGGLLINRLTDEAMDILPASGLYYMHEELGSSDDDDRVPVMIYFNKQTANIWSSYGTAYKVVIAFWLRHRRNSLIELKKPFALGGRYTVVVDHKGKVLAVPEPTTTTQKIRHHDAIARQTGSRVTHLSQLTVAIPSFLKTIYEDRKTPIRESLEEWAGGVASIAINASTAGVNAKQFMVLAERHGVAVRFDVGLANPKEFFRDRICALAADGKRKRIIHPVRDFYRQNPDGSRSLVTGHFRGLTEFDWHGSKITVLMPKNLGDPRRFPVAVEEIDEEAEIPPGTVGPEYVAERLRKVMLEKGAKRSVRRR